MKVGMVIGSLLAVTTAVVAMFGNESGFEI